MNSALDETFAGTDYCVLCDELFPTRSFKHADTTEQWSYYFRCVFAAKFTSDFIISKPAIHCPSAFEISVRVDQPRNVPQRFAIKHVQSGDLDQGQAHCFHSYCWQLLEESSKKHGYVVTPKSLLCFARATKNIYCLQSETMTRSSALIEGLISLISQWENAKSSNRGQPMDEYEANGIPGLLSLFSRMAALPLELQIMVLEYLESCPSRSLLAIESVQKLFRRIFNPTLTKQTGICKLGKTMTFHFQLVKDARYLCGCDNGTQLMGHLGDDKVVLFLPRQIKGVNFAIGPLGIRWLEFQATDGTSTRVEPSMHLSGPMWIGQITPRGFVRNLKLTWDVFKICALDIPQHETVSFGNHFMWDGNKPLPSNIVFRTDAYYDKTHPADPEYQVQGFSGWQLMRYLPLVQEGCVLYGITVFCTDGGAISGIESHFRFNDSDQLGSCFVGHKLGCPIHFRLAPTEHIASIFIRPGDLQFLGPFLIMQTSTGRSCYFGPIMNDKIEPPKLLATATHGRIAGIFVDALRLSSNRIPSLGISYYSCPESDICDPIPPSLLLHDKFPNMCGSMVGRFKTRALLNNIRTIKVCYNKERCSGMALEYLDSRVEIVGQWFESSPTRHKIIYDVQSSKPFEKLLFRMFNTGDTLVVKSIDSLPTSRPVIDRVAHVKKTFTRHRVLVWWFSVFSDVIFSRKMRELDELGLSLDI